MSEVAKRNLPIDKRLGELDLDNVVECAVLLDDIRSLEAQLATAKSRLTAAIVARASVDGETSYDLPGRMKATITSGKRSTVAADVLEAKLRKAGMPENRISEIVQQEVSYKVDLRAAKKAGTANPAYAEALKDATTTHDSQPSVTIRRR
jgi:hypothetical protein